jgi:hypothetical protein
LLIPIYVGSLSKAFHDYNEATKKSTNLEY